MGSFGDFIDKFIGSKEESDLYKRAGLKSGTTGNRPSLQRTDIDINKKEPWGQHRTNLERMEKGWAPIDKDNETIELHHIGQKPDSPLAELRYNEHRGAGNSGVLHSNNSNGSEFYGEHNRNEWKKEQKKYWKDRAAGYSQKTSSESLCDGISNFLDSLCDIAEEFSKIKK